MLITVPVVQDGAVTKAPSVRGGPIVGSEGPDVVMLDQVKGAPLHGRRFEHLLHEKMSTMTDGCVNCHHDAKDNVEKAGETSPSGLVIRPCRTCHEPNSVVATGDVPGLRGAYHRQCLSCHTDLVNACGFCHGGSTTVKTIAERPRHLSTMLLPHANPLPTYVYETNSVPMPTVTFHHDEHTGLFGLDCQDCHVRSSCGKCHGSNIERPIVNRQQTCYQCHEDTRCIMLTIAAMRAVQSCESFGLDASSGARVAEVPGMPRRHEDAASGVVQLRRRAT